MIDIVAMLAVSSATRFYSSPRSASVWSGDVREAVFSHLRLPLRPAFFDTAQTGELISRLAADTTQIKSAVGVSVSTALRNMVLFLGSAIMMVVTSPRLSAFVLRAIPVIVLPLVGSAGWCAGARAPRRMRSADLCSRADGRCAHVQAYTNEALAGTRLRCRGRARLSGRRRSTRARARSPRSSSSWCSQAW